MEKQTNEIIQYTVIHALKKEDLIHLANDAILKGWQPIGGIATFGGNISSGFGFYQAFVKYKKA